MADDTLDKEGRESVLSRLGLYDEVSTPDQLGGSLTLNKVQYHVYNNQLLPHTEHHKKKISFLQIFLYNQNS